MTQKLNLLCNCFLAGSSTTVTRNPECEGLYSFINFKASAVCFTNPLKTGRYVGITTTKQQFLQLCEVEIYSRGILTCNNNYYISFSFILVVLLNTHAQELSEGSRSKNYMRGGGGGGGQRESDDTVSVKFL